jgi:hypothetical protein
VAVIGLASYAFTAAGRHAGRGSFDGCYRSVREIDDLALVECSTCFGKGRTYHGRQVILPCADCHGTGDHVVHKVKYYLERVRPRRRRAWLGRGA